MDYLRTNNVPMYETIEKQIRDNQFKSKEELIEYVIGLKNQNILSDIELERILNFYDEHNKETSIPLDMEKYKGVGLENQNLIVSTDTNQVLITQESPENIVDEFRQVQNEMVAQSTDAQTNAQMIFNHMATNQKEELKLIPLSQVYMYENIDIEVLQKIKFFITNKYVNPYEYQVDVTNGIFYNVRTSEVLEVRKDENTDEYHIYKGSEVVYGDAYQTEEQIDKSNPENSLISDTPEEEKAYDSRNKPKVRTLKPQPNRHYGNAAFSKISFLALSIIIFTTIILSIMLFNK